MGATLVKALKRRGLGALTATSETLAVQVPGTLTQRVYSPAAPKSATATAAKPVLIAAISHTFAAAGSASLKLRMTAAGRRAVRRAHALKLAIVTRFAPRTGTVVTTVTRVRVTARAQLSARDARRRRPAATVRASPGAWPNPASVRNW
jgi:hypothetical protein